MELKKDVIIKAGEKFLTAPNVSRRNGKWYSTIVGIGNNHYAELVIDNESLEALNAQPQEDKEQAENDLTTQVKRLEDSTQILREFYEACMKADAEGELSEHIDGTLLDRAKLLLT